MDDSIKDTTGYPSTHLLSTWTWHLSSLRLCTVIFFIIFACFSLYFSICSLIYTFFFFHLSLVVVRFPNNLYANNQMHTSSILEPKSDLIHLLAKVSDKNAKWRFWTVFGPKSLWATSKGRPFYYVRRLGEGVLMKRKFPYLGNTIFFFSPGGQNGNFSVSRNKWIGPLNGGFNKLEMWNT